MGRFILGVLATIAVQIAGWGNIESALAKASATVRGAYATVEHTTAHIRADKGGK